METETETMCKTSGLFRKRQYRYILPAVLLILVLSGCGSREEAPMGRYADRDVQMADGGYTYMHPLADGGYYLFGEDADLTLVDAEGTVGTEVWNWEQNANIKMKIAVAVSDEGAVFFSYRPKITTEEEYEALGGDREIWYLYYYVDKEGSRRSLELYGTDYRKGINLEYFAFSPENHLYAASDSCVYRIDVESGEAVSLFGTEGMVEEFAFLGNTMVAIDDRKAYLYDMAGNRLLDGNSVIDEFVSTHQSGRIALAAKDGILYFACRTGLYRYLWDGAVMEQIADGRLVALGDGQHSPQALQALENGEFRVYFGGNRMTEMYYDETLPARPEKELVIFSLEENGYIRYAGQLFQKEHPDVLVKYETGMDGDNAVSKEDALKNLNTRLLAGESPDIIILDGMDMEQYAKKGVLKELDGFLAPYLEEDILYQKIVEGMRTREEGNLYGIPMSVDLPFWLSEKQYLDGENGLADLVEGMERARADHPEGPLLFTPHGRDLLNQLIPVCLPAWTGEDGSLETGKIEEFYQAALTLWELDCAGLPGDAREKWQENIRQIYNPEEQDMLGIEGGQYVDNRGIGETWAQFGILDNIVFGMSFMHMKMFAIRDAGGKPGATDEVVYGTFTGQAKQVFRATTVTGICSQAAQPELAEDFMELLLSDKMMNKWWLQGNLSGGIPIRKESVEKILDINNHEFAEMKGFNEKDTGFLHDETCWPSEEEKQWLYGLMEDASCCYRSGSMLEETVKEIGLRVLNGDITPKEGADMVAGKMAIEMEE